MNAPTTQQRQALAAYNEVRYPSLRSELAAHRAEPVRHLHAVPVMWSQGYRPTPILDRLMPHLIDAAKTLAGLAVWASVCYATWFVAGVYAAMQGVK